MKTKEMIITVIGAIAAMFVIVFAMRLFSSATTTVSVIEPEKGIHCAKMVTGDGAAISCWKVEL